MNVIGFVGTRPLVSVAQMGRKRLKVAHKKEKGTYDAPGGSGGSVGSAGGAGPSGDGGARGPEGSLPM